MFDKTTANKNSGAAMAQSFVSNQSKGLKTPVSTTAEWLGLSTKIILT